MLRRVHLYVLSVIRTLLSYLYTDLDRLPVSTLGVWDTLCVVLAVINHRLLVPGLLLQREDDSTNVHVPVKTQTRSIKIVLVQVKCYLCIM